MSLCSNISILPPVITGAEVLAVTATLVTNFSRQISAVYYTNHDAITVRNATFCNVTVSYTHPGQGDYVSVETWLPPTASWNGRLQAMGGAGWGPGRFDMSYESMAGAIGEGYATTGTDAGISNPYAVEDWLFEAPGKTNEATLRNWGGVALNDMAIAAKAVIKNFYGKSAEYSYFCGCSQGGRQGYELAQRYPTAFDGIAAAAPAMYWPQWAPAMLWPQVVMNTMGEPPMFGCELDFLTAAVARACDDRDGISDNLISDPASCRFDPFEYISYPFYCAETASIKELSRAAAIVANATWTGPRDSDGKFIWFGMNYGSDLTGNTVGTGVATTKCVNGKCTGSPVTLGLQWIQLFVNKGLPLNFTTMTRRDYDEIMRRSAVEYDLLVGSGNPDLREFQKAGGKMMTYHGLFDQFIPIQATEKYYNEVTELIPDVHKFFRFYEVPALAHCFGNGQPTTVFDALRAWVEKGTEPDSLPHSLLTWDGKKNDRIICPYPQKGRFDQKCGDPASARCFSCA